MDQNDMVMYRAGAENAQLNKWFEDPEELILELEAMLRGKRILNAFDEKGVYLGHRLETDEEAKTGGGKSKMNELGIRDVLHFVTTNMNKNVTLSNVNTREVYRDCKLTCLQFVGMACDNADEWELDINFYPELCINIQNIIWFSFNRPKDQGERIFIKKTYSESLNRSITTDNKPPSGFRIPGTGIQIGSGNRGEQQ